MRHFYIKIYFFITLLASNFMVSNCASVAVDAPPCLQQLELQFFRSDVVMQALSFYLIPQGNWGPIIDSLQRKSRGIPIRLKQATVNLVPNPLEYPFRPRVVARILRAVLYEVFMEAMTDFQSNELPTANFVFNYIAAQSQANWIRCFGEGSENILQGYDSPNSLEDIE